MPIQPILQSAPIRRGLAVVDDLTTAWTTAGGTSTSEPSISGVYIGSASKVFTFTCDAGGTIGSTTTITVSWADALGATGILNLGTDSSYTAGDVLLLADGLSIAFAAGTCVATDEFTVTVTARRVIRSDHRQIESDYNPTAVNIRSSRMRDRDVTFRSHDEIRYRDQRAMLRSPNVSLDWLGEPERKAMLEMIHYRHQVTLAEDYDSSTVFLARLHENLDAIVGEPIVLTRNSTRSYLDERTNLLKTVAANEPAFDSAPVGKGLGIQSKAATNSMATFHPTSSTLVWSAGGSSTVTFDSDVQSNLDPDDSGWDSKFLEGTARAFLANGTAGVNCAKVTGVATFPHFGQVWLRGHGDIDLNIRSGVVTPSTIVGTTNVTLDSDAWTLVTVEGDAAAGEGQIDLEVRSNSGNGIVWIGAAQIEIVSTSPASIIATDGGSAVSQPDTTTITTRMPHVGTLALWVYWPEITETSNHVKLFEHSGSNIFALRYNLANSRLQFQTTGSGQLTFTQALTANTWYHVAATWAKSDTDGSLDRALYLDGVQVAADTSSAWNADWGTSFSISKTGSSILSGIRFAEIRIDAVARTSAEITRWYERLTSTDWMNLHREYSGRLFEVSSSSDTWINPVQPDKYIGNLALDEVDFIDGSMVSAR